MTIQEAAQFLRVSTKTLRRWETQRILIPTRTTGNQRRYTQEQLTNFSHPQTSPRTFPQPSLSIDQAAQVLRVHPKTLRRWESQGQITPSRTVGGQRRYTKEQLESFSHTPQLPKSFQFSKPQKFLITASSVATLISLAVILYVHRPTINYEPTNQVTSTAGAVLASQTILDDLALAVNVPTTFARDLTAPNIIYSLTAGDNITITAGQTPTISASDQTASLGIFKSIKVGSTTFSAGSNADTLTFAAGDNASVSIDTSNKKLTFSATVPTSGITDDGSMIRLTTAGDIVSLGSATGSAKLSIESGDYSGDVLTASSAGNLLLKLSQSGTLTLNGSIIMTGNLTTAESGSIGFWQRSAGSLTPTNITDDLLIGATATSSAKIALNATTGQLTTTLFKLTTGGSAGYFLTSDASGVGSWTDISTSGTAGPWTLSGSSLFPDVNTSNLLVGSALVADDIGKLTVSGSKAGKALVVFNATNTDQDILTASASGVTKLSLSNAGDLTVAGNATLSGTLSLAPKLQVDAGTCNAGTAGKQYYDATNTKYYYCNGTNWFPVGETSGQISAFATACPSGWTEYTAARGRTVIGTPSSGTIAGTVGTALTNLEDRTHTHSVDPPSTGTSGSGSSGGSSGGCCPDTSFAPSHSHTVDIASFTSGTSSTSNIMPYIQLTYCQKDTGSDLAEWIGSNTDISTATIVSVDPSANEKVVPSSQPYDPTVVGIVATKPGWLIGDQTTGGVQMALAGRVPTRISLKNGEIKRGDPITTSDIPGVGMKATQAGPIIGKAMEEASGSPDTITIAVVFINPSYYNPDSYNPQEDALFLTTINSQTGEVNPQGKYNVIRQSSSGQLTPIISSQAFHNATIGNLTIGSASVSGTLTTSDITVNQLSLTGELAKITTEIASLSAQLSNLKLQSTPPPLTILNTNWQYSTESGKLISIYPTQVSDLTITGKLSVGLLTFDDLASSISSLTGIITINGDLAVDGSLRVLGSSAGYATIPAGSTSLTLDSQLIATSSAVFATADEPIPLGTQATEPGKFIIKIPSALPADLKVKWWIVN